MSQEGNIPAIRSANAPVVDDAVGVPAAPAPKWYIAVVNVRHEKKCADQLLSLGHECYVPVQPRYRLWRNGRQAKVDHVVIPAVIFVRCTERERREIVKLPFIFRFMTDKAGTLVNGLHKPLAVVSDREIATLRFMLGQSDIPVDIVDQHFRPGQLVKIIRGSLAGLEAEVVDPSDDSPRLIVRLSALGCATLTIDKASLVASC